MNIRIVRSLVFLLWTCGFSLLLLEGSVRLLGIDEAGHRHIQLQHAFQKSTKIHPTWGWSFVPGIKESWDYSGLERTELVTSFSTLPIPGYTEYGMRDDGLNAGAAQIIPVFGDSMTFGATVELDEIWVEQLEKIVGSTDLLNLANGGGITKTVEQYKVLKERIPEHSTVIYAMWLGNEFFDNFAFKELQNSLELSRLEYELRGRKLNLLSRFRSLYLLSKVVDQEVSSAVGPETHLEYVAENHGVWDPLYGSFLLEPRNPVLLRYCQSEYKDQRLLKGIDNTSPALKAMKAMLGDKKLVVLLLPFKGQLYGDRLQKYRKDLMCDRPNKIVLEICSNLGITCLDLLPGMREERERQLFWMYDPHLTPEGQGIVAKLAKDLLEKRGVIP